MVECVWFERFPMLPMHVCYHYTTHSLWLGRWDLNSRQHKHDRVKAGSVKPLRHFPILNQYSNNRYWLVAIRYITLLRSSKHLRPDLLYAVYWSTAISVVGFNTVSAHSDSIRTQEPFLHVVDRQLFDFLPHFRKCPPVGNSLPASIRASLSLVNASQGRQYEVGVLTSLIRRKGTPYLSGWSCLHSRISHDKILLCSVFSTTQCCPQLHIATWLQSDTSIGSFRNVHHTFRVDEHFQYDTRLLP